MINNIIPIRTFPDKVVEMGGGNRGVNSGMILTNFLGNDDKLSPGVILTLPTNKNLQLQ